MNDRSRTPFVYLIVALIAAALLVTGCGDSDKDDTAQSQQTGEGATAGAKGDQAGGFAVEAGKIRNSDDVKQEQEEFSGEPSPVQVLSGDKSGVRSEKPKIFVVRTQKEYNAMMKQHFSHGVKKQPVAPTDWATRQHIGVFFPEEKKGTIVQVVDVSESKDGEKMLVRVAVLTPGKGCGVPSYTPRPFSIVETRKMSAETAELVVDAQPQSACK